MMRIVRGFVFIVGRLVAHRPYSECFCAEREGAGGEPNATAAPLSASLSTLGGKGVRFGPGALIRHSSGVLDMPCPFTFDARRFIL